MMLASILIGLGRVLARLRLRQAPRAGGAEQPPVGGHAAGPRGAVS